MSENKNGPASDNRGARDRLGDRYNEAAFAPDLVESKANAIRAELIGDDTATAVGYSVTSLSPVLSLARDLIDDGCGQHEPLEAWRGPILCLSVRSIGEAALLRVNGPGTGFSRADAVTIASPMRSPACPASPTPPAPEPAPPAPARPGQTVEKCFTVASVARPSSPGQGLVETLFNVTRVEIVRGRP